MTHVSATPADGTVNFKAPDGGWGWVIVISSFFIHMIMDGITYSLGTYLTLFTQTFGVSHGAVSIIHSLLPAVTLASGPIASIFTNRYGCRNTTIIGSIIAAFGFIISYWVTNFYVLYFTIGIVAGFGFGLIYLPAIVSVGYYFEKRRSLAIGIAVCGTGVGTFLLSPANAWLAEEFGWKGAFLIKAGFILNGCVCGAVMRPLPIEPSEIYKRNKKLNKSDSFADNEKNPQEMKEMIKQPPPQILVSEPNTCDTTEQRKLLDEMIRSNRIEKSVCSQDNINHTNGVEYDPLAFAKSLPLLNNNSQQHNGVAGKGNSNSRIRMNNHKKSQLSIKTAVSSMDILAHTRSLQTIRVSTTKIENTIAEVNESNDNSKASSGLVEKMKQYIDLTIFADVIFIYFAVSNFLTSLGFNAPYIYIVDQAIKLGINEGKAAWLLSTIGISNTFGRIVLGSLADLKSVNRLYLYSTVLTIAGLATMIEPFLLNFTGLFIYAIVFGFTSGGYVTITSILLVDLMGLDKLTNAFGILLVFQGVATAIGAPTMGFMYDALGTYHYPFLFTGAMIAISGAMCFFIPCFKTYKKPEQK